MSIPNPFRPVCGTLVGGVELPYIQPIMTGPATVSNTPSFACAIAGSVDSYSLWHVFADSGYWATTDALILTFERPLKINAIQCNFTLNVPAVVTNENGETVANLEIQSGLRNYDFQNAGYHKMYKFSFSTDGYVYGYKITLDAVYKS